MFSAWSAAILPFLVAACLLIVPGLLVRLAGWNPRRLGLYFLSPVISLAIVAAAANIAPVVGLRWSLLPVALLTVLAVVIAYLLRRWVGREAAKAPTPMALVCSVGGLVIAGAVMLVQLAYVFVGPQNISQSFDNVVHLNSIRLALDTGNASGLAIGSTSNIGFYPDGWHSVVTLVVQLSGVSIPLGVNAANLAIGSLLWPASCIALASALFKDRPAALASAAVLSTGFAAYPVSILWWGVLYPNFTGYAAAPAGIAAVVLLLRETGVAQRVRAAVLLLVILLGIGLAHPNAFLGVYAFGAVIAIDYLVRKGLRDRSRRSWGVVSAFLAGIIVVGVGLWLFARTPADMSGWQPWESTPQAIGEGLTATTRGYPLTITITLLIALGIVAVIVRPRRLRILLPFLVGVGLFVLAAGVSPGDPFRAFLTNPWYNDPYRLAALLPAVAIPVATLGAITVVDLVRALCRGIRIPRAVGITVGTAMTLVLLVLVGVVGPNIRSYAQAARASYQMTSSSWLLSPDERTLILRLDRETPANAVIAGSPRNGASLAYALANRQVTEKHMFGTKTKSDLILDRRLRYIDTDPAVCQAVRRLRVSYVLDFGSYPDVTNDPKAARAYAGLENLSPNEHLKLVDSVGPDKLFRVTGC